MNSSLPPFSFYVNLPVGGAALLLVFFLVHVPKNGSAVPVTPLELFLQLDFIGLVAIIGSLVSLTLALQWGGTTKPWSDGDVVACLVVWIVLTIVFVVIQLFQRDRAMIPLRLIANRTVWANCIYVFVINGPNFLLIYYLPIYFQSIVGDNAIESGTDILPAVAFFAVGCLSSGWLIGKLRYWQPFMTIGSLLSVIGSALIYRLDINTSRAWYLGSQVIFGFGAGSSSQVPMIAVQAFSQPGDVESATGIVLSIFSNQLLDALPRLAPTVDAAAVLATGAGDIRHVFAGEVLDGVLKSYMVGLKAVFAFSLATAAFSVLVSLLAPMKKLPAVKTQQQSVISGDSEKAVLSA
ncbi:hypothetical protein O1611_g2770 [Lasiodiplodia mahajangana]|uniref:Uncharacterized protein n=1 Tax=Lasiodiplodia mahajangana TaxID=1108764 RepID=A0ACC2JUC3_9PEZI|nr:hypothetical protein O1611_g2770 [Lasiodiplodia mahajangana]